MQKYGYMVNEYVKEFFVCQICGINAGFNWSDKHREAMCNKCGIPYQILHYDKDNNQIDKLPEISISITWIPIIKRYWEEKHIFIGLGSILIYKDYPECIEGQRQFNKWCKENNVYEELNGE